MSGFDAPLVRLWLLDRCFPLAQRGMSGRVLAHPAHAAVPRVLCSATVVLSLASSLLRPDPPVSRSPCALRSRACASGLATSRPSLLWVTDHSAGATTHAPEQTPPARARCFGSVHWPSPMRESGSAARYPTTRFTWEAVSTLQCSLSAAAPEFARPPDGSDLSALRAFA